MEFRNAQDAGAAASKEALDATYTENTNWYILIATLGIRICQQGWPQRKAAARIQESLYRLATVLGAKLSFTAINLSLGSAADLTLDALPPSSATGDVNLPSVVPPLTAPGTDFAGAGDLTAGLDGGFGAVAATQGIPDMIGDFFGGGYEYGVFAGGGTTAAIAGGDRRFKWSENNSPFPRNRFFFNYHHFENAVRDVNGLSDKVDRFTFGLEKTFLDGLTSVELRTPFASTVSTLQRELDPETTSAEFGNISLAVKLLLLRRQCFAAAMGLGIVFPNGDDAEIIDPAGASQVVFGNDAVHIQPFMGLYYSPNDILFMQFFTQLDFDANGNDFTLPTTSRFLPTPGPAVSGVLQEQTLLFLDYSMGVWLYRGHCDRLIEGVAPMVELHYSTTLEDRDEGAFGFMFVPENRRDVLNITGGVLFQLSSLSSLKVAGVAPLREEGGDRMFDAEFGIQFVRGY